MEVAIKFFSCLIDFIRYLSVLHTAKYSSQPGNSFTHLVIYNTYNKCIGRWNADLHELLVKKVCIQSDEWVRLVVNKITYILISLYIHLYAKINSFIPGSSNFVIPLYGSPTAPLAAVLIVWLVGTTEEKNTSKFWKITRFSRMSSR